MSKAPVYVKGDWKAVCDDCGKDYLASELRKRWDYLMVCSTCFEERQPQDYVRGSVDKMVVPWSRPKNQDQFVGGYCSPEGSCGIVGYGVVGCMVVGALYPLWFAPTPPGTFTP